jgi:hypothetical protein
VRLGFVLTRAAAFHRFKLRLCFIMVALALTIAVPSRGVAQTLSLGQAGGLQLFAVSDANSLNAGFNIFTAGGPSVVAHSLALGAGTTLVGPGMISVGQALYVDTISDPSNPASYDPSSVTVAGNNIIAANLSQAGIDAQNAATTAGGWNSSNANVLGLGTPVNGNYQINGSSANSGQNVLGFSNLLKLSNSTITINGTADQQFVFNFSQGLTFNNVKIVLTGGVAYQNVFFNVLGGNAGITNSAILGTILDLSGTTVNLSKNEITGSVISDGLVNISATILNPELPTVAMGGLACLLVLGKVGFNRLRRRGAISRVPSRA